MAAYQHSEPELDHVFAMAAAEFQDAAPLGLSCIDHVTFPTNKPIMGGHLLIRVPGSGRAYRRFARVGHAADDDASWPVYARRPVAGVVSGSCDN